LTLKVKFTVNGAEDFDYWEGADSNVLDKIKRLLGDICEHPFVGIGKPEPLNPSSWSENNLCV
jgi:toxin YoeB